MRRASSALVRASVWEVSKTRPFVQLTLGVGGTVARAPAIGYIMQLTTPILHIHPPQDIRTHPMGITDSDDQHFPPPVSPPERIIIREQSPAPPLPTEPARRHT